VEVFDFRRGLSVKGVFIPLGGMFVVLVILKSLLIVVGW